MTGDSDSPGQGAHETCAAVLASEGAETDAVRDAPMVNVPASGAGRSPAPISPQAASQVEASASDRYAFLSDAPAFSGIPKDKRAEVVRALDGMLRTYKKGEVIRHAGESLAWFGIVRTGEIQAGAFDGEHEQIIERFGPGEVFGEAIALTTQRCPVEIRAVQDAQVVLVRVAPLFAGELRPAASPYVTQLLANLMRDMAGKLMALNFKLRILREPRLRERVLLYLRNLCEGSGATARLPYTRVELAKYLGVDRSALSRELGRMQDDGLIRLDGRNVTLLRADGRVAGRP